MTNMTHASMQACVYHQIGQLVAISIAQGGSEIHTLNNSVYTYISLKALSTIDVSISEVPNPEVREILEKVWKCMYFFN